MTQCLGRNTSGAAAAAAEKQMSLVNQQVVIRQRRLQRSRRLNVLLSLIEIRLLQPSLLPAVSTFHHVLHHPYCSASSTTDLCSGLRTCQQTQRVNGLMSYVINILFTLPLLRSMYFCSSLWVLPATLSLCRMSCETTENLIRCRWIVSL